MWHLIHRGALWASGAAQAAQFVRIILRFCGELFGFARRLDSACKTRFFQLTKTHAGRDDPSYAINYKKTQPYTAPINPLNSLCAADSFR